MKTYNPKSYVRKPMMYGGAVKQRKKMVLGGNVSNTPMLGAPAMSATPPMGAGMMQDKRNKTRQTMMGMRRGGRASGRNR